MDKTFARIFGWILLLIGLIIIGWTLYNSYFIYTGEFPLPGFFPLSEETGDFLKGQDLQDQLKQMMAEQLEGLIPANSIPQILNLTVWAILAGILIFGGGQIAGLGIRMLK